MITPNQYPPEFHFDYLLSLIGQHDTQPDVERFIKLAAGSFYNYFEVHEPMEDDGMNFSCYASEILGFSLNITDNRIVQNVSFITPQFYLKQASYYPLPIFQGILIEDSIDEVERKTGLDIRPRQRGHLYLENRNVMFALGLDYTHPDRINYFKFFHTTDPTLEVEKDKFSLIDMLCRDELKDKFSNPDD